jgi:predicted nucleic acid-binding protein
MHRALIGTSSIYAFVTRTDAHHAAAREFMRECLAARARCFWPTSCLPKR